MVVMTIQGFLVNPAVSLSRESLEINISRFRPLMNVFKNKRRWVDFYLDASSEDFDQVILNE